MSTHPETPATPEASKPHHCRHIFTEGRRCGSPALRGEKLCFYHHTARRPNPHRTQFGTTRFTFPEPEDLHAVQRSLGEVLRLLANRDLNRGDAGPILRTLAIASVNLARIQRQEARLQAQRLATPDALALTPIQDIVLDPTLGPIAPGPEPNPEPALKPAIELVPAPIAGPEPSVPTAAEALLLPPDPAAAEPTILPDPLDEAIRRHNLPTETVALFDYAKIEMEAFTTENCRRRTAGEPPLAAPFRLTGGIPIHPTELYLHALEKLDRMQSESTPAPAEPLTYPASNQDFRTFAKCA